MAPRECEECQEILREFRELLRLAHHDRPAAASIAELMEWSERRAQDDKRGMQLRLSLARVRQRMMEHHQKTGHMVRLLPLPPGSLTNPN